MLLEMRPEGVDERFKYHVGILLNLAILQYELGRMANALVYGISAKVNMGDERLAKGHFALAKSECADLLIQVQSIAERMGWNLIELQEMGIDRYKTRMQELKEKVI